MKKTITI